MPLRQQAEKTVTAILTTMELDANHSHKSQLVRIVENALIEAALDERQRCVHAINQCCSEDSDTAHKISRKIQQRQLSVIANLEGMR